MNNNQYYHMDSDMFLGQCKNYTVYKKKQANKGIC